MEKVKRVMININKYLGEPDCIEQKFLLLIKVGYLLAFPAGNIP